MSQSEPACPDQASIEVDLDAIVANVATLRGRVQRPLMAVVKADAYGHGLVPVARAALAGGADALGVTTLAEAHALRDAGITARIMSWLHSPGTAYAPAIERDIELGLSRLAALDAAAEAPGVARVHLKVDTGLSRAGVTSGDWPEFVERAAKYAADGQVEVVGIWSHFACADSPGHPSVRAQCDRLVDAADVAREMGLGGFDLHIANSAATLTDPGSWFDMVRPGIAIYGLDPMGDDAAEHGLRPAMRARAATMMVKDVPAGTGVSYGHTYTTATDTRLALVPVGYADGIPRAASNAGLVRIGERKYQVAGRICMDQFVLDVGDDDVRPGDDVIIFGDPAAGDPPVEAWARSAGTINYEIVSRIGGRFARHYTGALADELGLAG
nr:alanine racemase [Epidermidibacterium keratini]